MSVRVVKVSHVTGDDYVRVPSCEDLDDIKCDFKQEEYRVLNRISEVERSQSQFIKKTDFDKLKKQVKGKFDDLRTALVNELEEGEWRKKFINVEIEQAIAKVESRFQNAHDELQSTLIKMPSVDDISKVIDQIFVDHSRRIESMISNAGNSVRQMIERERKKTLESFDELSNAVANAIKMTGEYVCNQVKNSAEIDVNQSCEQIFQKQKEIIALNEQKLDEMSKRIAALEAALQGLTECGNQSAYGNQSYDENVQKQKEIIALNEQKLDEMSKRIAALESALQNLTVKKSENFKSENFGIKEFCKSVKESDTTKKILSSVQDLWHKMRIGK